MISRRRGFWVDYGRGMGLMLLVGILVLRLFMVYSAVGGWVNEDGVRFCFFSGSFFYGFFFIGVFWYRGG